MQYSVHCTSLHFTPAVLCTPYITALYSCSTMYTVHQCIVFLQYSVHCISHTVLFTLYTTALYSCSNLYYVHYCTHCTVLLQYSVHCTSLHCTSLHCTPTVLCTLHYYTQCSVLLQYSVHCTLLHYTVRYTYSTLSTTALHCTPTVPPTILDEESSPSTVSIREKHNASLICKSHGVRTENTCAGPQFD